MTTPAGSEDAGLVLSAEERKFVHALHATPINPTTDGCPLCVVEVRVLTRIVAARVEATRAEERERIADCSRCGKASSTLGDPKDLPVCQWCAVEVGAEVERERIAAAVEADRMPLTAQPGTPERGWQAGHNKGLSDAARIARTPTPAGDDERGGV